MIKKNVFVILAISLSIYSQQNRLDGIAAIVGDESILISELNAYTTLRMNNLGIKNDSSEFKKYQDICLNEIIDGKILLVHGKKDTTISVSDDDVEQATNNHIQMLLKQNNLSIDSLEIELQRQQGISLAKFKADARKIIREQLIKQKVQQMYLFNTKITRKDVASFFSTYKDSLPTIGESVLLSKFSVNIQPSEKIKQNAFEKITAIKNLLDNGQGFEDVAKKYSESPDGKDGGDLGFIAKGTLSEISFEEKAFNTTTGQISEPFETRLGFHIIKVTERRDQKVHLKQIFIKVEALNEDMQKTSTLLDSIRNICKNKNDFLHIIKYLPKDIASQSKVTEMGWITTYDLPSEIKTAIDSLQIGSISKPIISNSTITIYYLDDKVSQRKVSLENDYSLLEEKAKDVIAQKKLISLVSQWRKKIFIDKRL